MWNICIYYRTSEVEFE